MPASIPVEVADITADWLEEALAAHATGASVQVIEVAEAHEGTTGRARVLLTHDDPRLPRSVFVKLAPFYSEIAADVPVRHPRPWYAAHDDARRYIMVLEDLTAAGARYPNQHNNDLPEFVEATIDAFAAPHAAFWESPRFAADGDLAWVVRRSRGYGSAAPFVSFAVERMGSDLPEASRRLAQVYMPRADGDAHLGNMFADGTSPGFLD